MSLPPDEDSSQWWLLPTNLKQSKLLRNKTSKPKQIAKAIVKIGHQIFGKIDNVEVAIIGDEEMVEDISENLKKFSFKNFRLFDKSIDDLFDEKLKKIVNELKFLNDYKNSDIFF